MSDLNFQSFYSMAQNVSLVDPTSTQNTDGNKMNLVYWTYRDFADEAREEDPPLYFQMEII